MILVKKLLPFFVLAACMTNVFAEEKNIADDSESAVVIQEQFVATESPAEKKVVEDCVHDVDQQQEYVVKISCDDENNVRDQLIVIGIMAGMLVLAPTLMVMYLQYKQESSPDWQLSNLQSQKRLEYEQAKHNFQKCLWGVDSGCEKGLFNCPLECQKLACQFMRCGGKDEMRQMIDASM